MREDTTWRISKRKDAEDLEIRYNTWKMIFILGKKNREEGGNEKLNLCFSFNDKRWKK